MKMSDNFQFVEWFTALRTDNNHYDAYFADLATQAAINNK